MKVTDLKTLQESGEFHHATYRNMGTLWEGLHIYAKDSTGFRGYRHVGAFLKDSPELTAAEALCNGISVGAFGEG